MLRRTNITMDIILVCLVFLMYMGGSHRVSALIVGNGTSLAIMSQTYDDDMAFFRKDLAQPGSTCNMKTLIVFPVKNFTMTPEDIDVLQTCPLQKLLMRGTSCFRGSELVDLSSLTTLEILWITDCSNDTFVVTGLPESLQELKVYGLTEKNFRLENSDGNFGKHLEKIQVSDSSMCCPEVVLKMFGRHLPHMECVFDHDGDRGTPDIPVNNCDDPADNGTVLTLENHQQLSFFRETLGGSCGLEYLYVKLPNLTLTEGDMDVIRQCPLVELDLGSTFCDTTLLVNLSSVATLQVLDIGNCGDRNVSFVVTGLPASLKTLNIQGLAESNFHLSNNNLGMFGTFLEMMYVTNASMCCPNVLTRMFGFDPPDLVCSYQAIGEPQCYLLDRLEQLVFTSRSAIHMLKENVPNKCKVKSFFGMKEFYFENDDIITLQSCPLEELSLVLSYCFSEASHIDMSGLISLKVLSLTLCRNRYFVITALPDSIEELRILGLTEDNFLSGSLAPRGFGKSLNKMEVSKASLCCPTGMVQAFGRHISGVECQYISGSGRYKRMNYKIKCGLSKNDTELMITSHEDLSLLRNDKIAGHCRLQFLLVELPEFKMTQSDVNTLAGCPLRELHLIDSHCFSPSVQDLSRFVNLTILTILYCRSSDFVITGLPTSLQKMNIPALADFNIQLGDQVSDGGRFGDSLGALEVYNGAMCCNHSLSQMFRRDLSKVCQSIHGHRCGLGALANEVVLSVDSRQQLHSYTQELVDGCNITNLHVTGRDFFMTQADINILSTCPVREVDLGYTSCFYGPVNLSRMSTLIMLYFPYCVTRDFTITGLPDLVEELDIRGVEVTNIQLKNKETTFSSSMKLLEVSNPTFCSCPQATAKMFGTALPEMTKCGITESIFSASSSMVHRTYISEGLKSAISSCEHLIDNFVLRVLLWTMATLATFGNISVVFYRLVWDRSNLNTSHGLYPINLAISDLLMGVYLFFIATADAVFRGEYVIHDTTWRLGALCQLSGFLSTLSSETSALFMLLITIDRFLVIQFPFGQIRISLKVATFLSCMAWLSGLVIAGLPLVVSDWEVYSFHSICVGLPLNTDVYKGSGYTTAIFIGFNSFLFSMIAVGQVAIYRAKSATSSKIKLQGDQARRRYKQDMALARRLSLIVITDFMCWFPICIMGLVARGGYPVSNSAYAWSAVVVLPINSSINPLLYTLINVITSVINSWRQRNTTTQSMTSHKLTSEKRKSESLKEEQGTSS